MAPKKKTTKKKVEGAQVALELPVFSVEGKQLRTMALPERMFNAPWRADLVHQVITAMQANLRQNRAHTKDRSEVSGGGKKPWKQKGTGQARHGSSRSPIWRHGGITFGPRTARDYSEKVNKKMRVQALASILSRKAKDGEVVLVDAFAFSQPKSAQAKLALQNIAKGAGLDSVLAKKNNAALIALGSYNTNAIKSFANFGNIMTEEVRNLNPLEVLTAKYVLIEKPETSLPVLDKRVTGAHK